MPPRSACRPSRAAALAIPVGLLLLLLLSSNACSIGATYWPTDEEMEAFEAAGPVDLEDDTAEELVETRTTPGPYRAAVGDILSVSGSDAILLSTSFEGGLGGASNQRPLEIEARVHPDGSWNLPVVGELNALDREMWELEDALAEELDRYSNQTHKPALLVRVVEKATRKVDVLGAVESPGTVELPSDRLTLFGALSEAGGILKASNLKVGARLIRVRRPGMAEKDIPSVPVEGLNIPLRNIALQGGETIEVLRWDPDIFTVIGLVTKPGAYEYPPNREYNLMDALAVAGGTDRISDPPYATVYRKDQDGQVLAVTFPLQGDDLVRASLVPIRPGDVISVQHTFGSWTRSLIAQVVRLQVNFFVDPIRD